MKWEIYQRDKINAMSIKPGRLLHHLCQTDNRTNGNEWTSTGKKKIKIKENEIEKKITRAHKYLKKL